MPHAPALRFVDRIEELPEAATLAGMSGFEVLQAILQGRLPAPPIFRTIGYSLVEVGEGRAEFEGAPAFGHLNPLGAVHGGWYAVLLDSCMGCAVHSRLPHGKGYTTLEYKVNILRPAGPETGTLRAVGEAVHVGRRTGVAEGRIVDRDGRLFAQGTTTCLIFDL
jgi:uncharacterized protein (TIGR00369 family)